MLGLVLSPKRFLGNPRANGNYFIFYVSRNGLLLGSVPLFNTRILPATYLLHCLWH